jgi:outer membrane murein-binding lipoprotein Lpp
MSDEGPDSIVLRYLRGIDTKVDALRDDVRDLKARITAVEHGLNAVRRDLVALAEADARQQASTDRLGDRIERIENRLSLRDA